MSRFLSIITFCTAVTLSSVAFSHNHEIAQHSGHGGHEGHGAGSHGGHGAKSSEKPANEQNAAVKDYEAVMSKMHKDMDIKYTGDADADFVRGMIPHHQGAVDMAKVLLEHGSDPGLKRLAEEIIASQQKEISFMKNWLEARPAAK